MQQFCITLFLFFLVVKLRDDSLEVSRSFKDTHQNFADTGLKGLVGLMVERRMVKELLMVEGLIMN